MKIQISTNHFLTRYFTLWIILFSIFSYCFPSGLSRLIFLIKPALIVIMFGMVMTLKLSDFKEVILRPKEIALGTSLQFLIMPLLGFLSAKIFRLSPELAAGVILLGSCPGGTASNVIVYLAKGDVALSGLPSGLFSVWHNVEGSILAYWWRKEYNEN